MIRQNRIRLCATCNAELTLEQGMSFEDLRRWATMGLSQADNQFSQPGEEPKNDESVSGLISRYLCEQRRGIADVCRFGVGAKKAAFFLGDEITVTTKTADSNVVFEARLSVEELKETSDQVWRANIVVRNPKGKELDKSSFTLVRIRSPILLGKMERNIETIRKELAHIYHYYIVNTRSYHQISLNGQALDQVGDSLEKMYIERGKNETEFQIKVEYAKGKVTTVKSVLRYFPFEDGEETLPIPLDVRDGDTSMLSRKPGIEVFWNGRLIPGAHFDKLRFMKKGTIDGSFAVCRVDLFR